ncbi:MAG: hypothetical protein WCF18_08580 [Chthoniobacteraceae bacterium]
MKSDTTTTALNIILAVLVLLGVIFALFSINRTRELKRLNITATFDNTQLMRAANLANDTATYNVTAKSPELARLLQSIQPKPAAK